MKTIAHLSSDRCIWAKMLEFTENNGCINKTAAFHWIRNYLGRGFVADKYISEVAHD